MILKNDIDNGLLYFGIDGKYKEQCYQCCEEINANSLWLDAFKRVFDFLNYGDVDSLKTVWDLNDISQLFTEGIPPFATNLMVVLGYKTLKENIFKAQLDEGQIQIYKQRVKTIFEEDYAINKYGGIKFIMMSWAYYFIRMRIIEIGRLQYENFDGKCIRIHIPDTVPSGEKFDRNAVVNSIKKSEDIVRSLFGLDNPRYECTSWLLSKEVVKELGEQSNIYKFYSLFDVEEGEDCLHDIFDNVFPYDDYDDYNALSEDTSLKKMIKEKILKGVTFRLGKGVLKGEY